MIVPANGVSDVRLRPLSHISQLNRCQVKHLLNPVAGVKQREDPVVVLPGSVVIRDGLYAWRLAVAEMVFRLRHPAVASTSGIEAVAVLAFCCQHVAPLVLGRTGLI